MVNLKNDDDECFRWCHIRYLNPQEKDPQRIKKSDKEILLQLDYEGTEFPVSVKDYSKLEWKNTTNINVFGSENKQFYPIYVSKECNEDVLNLLLITKDEKKHQDVYARDAKRSAVLPKDYCYQFEKPLKRSDEDEQHFQAAKECYINNFVTRYIPIKISASGIIVILQVITGDLHTKIVILS